ncbi:carboxypeptidase-like regulatory domain-containing protein [Candidatus Palauibacter sp.]|uniref:carboxypeptidase-like regulatory domain-containing protein n=1 Tax=Candidatus Palauibacter sp. TaxID=3101350 RepID=UPI003B5C2792
MTNRPFLVRAGSVASLGIALLALPIVAQEAGSRLSGVLVTEGSGVLVEGAHIALVNSGDVVLSETLSDGRGAFSLPRPAPGVYRVQVSRIGYEPWASDTLHIASASDSRTLRLELPVRPIPLPELLVSEQNTCPNTPEEERRQAFDLYGSVLPILASASSTSDLGALRMQMIRPITVWRRGTRSYARDTTTVVARESLNNAPPEHLVAYGYAEAINDSMTTYYAPDGDALADPGFLATHCLSLVEDEDEKLVGLAFEPKLGRELVDVKGVLWIDAIGGGPQELEFQYTSLRPFLRRYLEPSLRAEVRSRIPESMQHRVSFHRIEIDESRFGGVLHFERIARDRWLIREWRILSPTLLYRSLTEGGRKSVWPVAIPLSHSGEVLALIPP